MVSSDPHYYFEACRVVAFTEQITRLPFYSERTEWIERITSDYGKCRSLLIYEHICINIDAIEKDKIYNRIRPKLWDVDKFDTFVDPTYFSSASIICCLFNLDLSLYTFENFSNQSGCNAGVLSNLSFKEFTGSTAGLRVFYVKFLKYKRITWRTTYKPTFLSFFVLLWIFWQAEII